MESHLGKYQRYDSWEQKNVYIVQFYFCGSRFYLHLLCYAMTLSNMLRSIEGLNVLLGGEPGPSELCRPVSLSNSLFPLIISQYFHKYPRGLLICPPLAGTFISRDHKEQILINAIASIINIPSSAGFSYVYTYECPT